MTQIWLFLVEIVTTECTETPLAAQKAAKEKASSKCPAAISSPVGMATRRGGERRLLDMHKSYTKIPVPEWCTLVSDVSDGLFPAAFSVPRMRASVCSDIMGTILFKPNQAFRKGLFFDI